MDMEKNIEKIWWKGGFYDYAVDGAVEITGEYWQELLRGQEQGYVIGEDESGYPVLRPSGPLTLQEHREAKIAQIADYDSSSAVNSFTINGASMWLDKATRTSLAASFNAEERAGRSRTVLWTATQPPIAIELPIDTARQLLDALEIYAKDAYNVTQGHIAAVCGLGTIEAVKAYDHTQGYPEKLEF